MKNSLGKVYRPCLITSKYLRMEIKKNFKKRNSFLHLQTTSAFFPELVSSSVEKGCYSGCLNETDVKKTCDVWEEK